MTLGVRVCRETLRSGTVDVDAAAEITRCILSGKDDAVARGLLGAPRSAELAALVNATAPAIAQALRETSPADRETLSHFLKAVAPTAKPMVPSLVQGLRHERPEVRRGAAITLGAMGSAGKPAADDLHRALDDPDADVRAAAADALKRIDPLKPIDRPQE